MVAFENSLDGSTKGSRIQPQLTTPLKAYNNMKNLHGAFKNSPFGAKKLLRLPLRLNSPLKACLAFTNLDDKRHALRGILNVKIEVMQLVLPIISMSIQLFE